MPINTPIADKLEKLEKEVRSWGQMTRKDLLTKLGELDLMGQNELIKSLRTKIYKRQGDLEGVSFSFLRHGIFLERGVGAKRPVGSEAAKKAAKPWLSAVLPSSAETLATVIANEYADIASSEIKINIPGIISTNVKR